MPFALVFVYLSVSLIVLIMI